MASGKRLCQVQEWQQACRGPENKKWGYGDDREFVSFQHRTQAVLGELGTELGWSAIDATMPPDDVTRLIVQTIAEEGS